MSRTTTRLRPVRSVMNILLAVLMTFGVSAAIAPAAQAAPQAECWSPWNVNGEGRGYLNRNINLKSGPYASGCDNWAPGFEGERVFYLCYTYNSHGNKWWYVRIANTDLHGWTSADNIWDDSIDENGNGQIDHKWC